MKTTSVALSVFFTCVLGVCSAAPETRLSTETFLTPPVTARPMVYWDWICGNINRAAITRDLEHMKRVGLGGGLLFDVPPLNGSYAACPPEGPVAFMSDEWLGLVNFAAEESHRLGLDFGIVLCEAWNTGGPWIKPKDNNQLVASALLRVSGPQKKSISLPAPSDDPDYVDTAVLAWPTPANESHLMTEHPPAIKVNGKPGNERQFKAMMDGDRSTGAAVPAPKKNSPTVIEFVFPEPITVDRFYAQEDRRQGIIAGRLEAEVNGATKKMADLESDGATPLAVEFPPVTAKIFRLIATATPKLGNLRDNMRLYEVAFVEPGKWSASEPEIRNWALKKATVNALGKRRSEIQLPTDHLLPTVDARRAPAIAPASVLNLTAKLGTDGRLAWDVPAGNWTIQRIGMMPGHSHTYNAEGRKGNEDALESDKMSVAATQLHYKSMAGAIFDHLSPEGRKGLGYFEVDSWEGEMNLWTAGFLDEFKKRRGYDLTPYLPVFEGKIVGDGATADRVLWDYRRTIGDLNIANHFKKLADLCHNDGIKLCAESGHGFQANMDAIGSLAQVDYPAGEFWNPGRDSKRYDVRNSVKDAASAVNVYGKAYGLFESFTTGQIQNFWPSPFDLKILGDNAFTEGVSRMFIHGMWLDPIISNTPPGISWSAGIHVGPSITWMPDGRAFFDYLARCQYLLQAGVVDKDALYFYGDGMPNIAPKSDELPFHLPAGRDYDATDSRAIREMISVRDGKLTLPHGATYRTLVLPPLDTMLPETLEAIHRLVKDGAVVIGPKPLRSPSLSGQPEADRRVCALADELWGVNPGTSGTKQTGKGTVHWGTEFAAACAAHGIPPQIEIRGDSAAEIKHLHRRTLDGRDIYFLVNEADQPFAAEILFRSAGKRPYLWQPDTGEIIRLPAAAEESGRSRLPVRLAPHGSTFVVFDPEAGGQPVSGSKPQAVEGKVVSTIKLTGAWEVAFEKNRGAPAQATFSELQSWTANARPGIKYFSGYGVYSKKFAIPELKSQIILDLGQVGDVAHVKVNGRDFGTLWKPPFRVDITAAVKAGSNELEVAVVNTWVNRLIGDDQFPKEKPVANFLVRGKIPAMDLDKCPSGLLGPVKVEVIAAPEIR
ncbi:MAG: glycosyl hydrolase [Verrucomicrobiae bacterium]